MSLDQADVLPLCYIGHPLHGLAEGWSDPNRNVERYLRFAALFSNAGFAVVSWVHHELLYARRLTPVDPEFYLTRDEALLRACRVFVQAGPLEVSAGLTREHGWAKNGKLIMLHVPRWDDPGYWPEGDPLALDVRGVWQQIREAREACRREKS